MAIITTVCGHVKYTFYSSTEEAKADTAEKDIGLWYCVNTGELVKIETANRNALPVDNVPQPDGNTYICPGNKYHPQNRARFPD